MYIEYSDYTSFYGTSHVSSEDFPRYELEASRVVDLYTTGVDGYRKLKEAFPEDEGDARIVKFCCASLVDALWQIAQANEAARPVTTANGTHSGVISSVSAGNESISYGGADASTLSKAASDISAKAKLMDEMVIGTLRGITDANGVNLLFGGRYPNV